MGDLAKINTNIPALRAYQTLTNINERLVKSQERIATGQIVNRASDSPSDYYISKAMQCDINAVKRKNDNIERGINFLQTNDSRLASVVNILIEMSDRANQANSIAVTSAEKQAIQQDLYQMSLEIESIFQSGVSQRLYTGFTLAGLKNVSLTGNLITDPLGGLTIDGTNLNVTGSQATLDTTIRNLDAALDRVLRDEERVGSFIRRLEVEYSVNEDEITNLKSSLGSIVDTDLAKEQLELTKLSILQQVSVSMLAQANTAPQALLQLFS